MVTKNDIIELRKFLKSGKNVMSYSVHNTIEELCSIYETRYNI